MHILVVEALLIAIYSTGDKQILIHKRKPCQSRTCLVRIAGPCPAVPAQLGLSPAGPYQLWCTSLRIATDTRPTRNSDKLGLDLSSRGNRTPCYYSRHHPNSKAKSNRSIEERFFSLSCEHFLLLRGTRGMSQRRGISPCSSKGRSLYQQLRHHSNLPRRRLFQAVW